MVPTRVIPALLLKDRSLVKTVQFKNPRYVGDPLNAVKIFNEKEVDELIILDISATIDSRPPQFDLIHDLATESFMPVAYGGGVRGADELERIISLGIEKVVLCTHAVECPQFVSEAAGLLGSSCVAVCLDVKEKVSGEYEICTRGGRRKTGRPPVDVARQMEAMGAGELVVNSIDRDGTMLGYDLEVLKEVTSAVSIPVIALGGAGSLGDLQLAVKETAVSAVAAGSLFVFQGKHRAVLISYPDSTLLRGAFDKEDHENIPRYGNDS